MPQCTAKAKATGERCRRQAVTGYPVCQVHGAGSPHKGRPGGAPPTHGRYSVAKRRALQEKIEQFYNDPAAGDLRSELALMRALLQDYLDRFVDGVPLAADDIQRLFDMIEAIGRLVERIAKILSTTALTQAELQLLQVALIDAVSEFISEPERQRAFVSRVLGATAKRVGAGSSVLLGG